MPASRKCFSVPPSSVGRGCQQRMQLGRAPHKGKSAGTEVSGARRTPASRKPLLKLYQHLLLCRSLGEMVRREGQSVQVQGSRAKAQQRHLRFDPVAGAFAGARTGPELTFSLISPLQGTPAGTHHRCDEGMTWR